MNLNLIKSLNLKDKLQLLYTPTLNLFGDALTDKWIVYLRTLLVIGICFSLSSLFLPMLSFSVFGKQPLYMYHVWISFSSESLLKFLLISILFYPYMLLFAFLWILVSRTNGGQIIKHQIYTLGKKLANKTNKKRLEIPSNIKEHLLNGRIKNFIQSLKKGFHLSYFLGLVNLFIYFAYYINPFHSLWKKGFGVFLIGFLLIIGYYLISQIKRDNAHNQVKIGQTYRALYSLLSFTYTTLLLFIFIERADTVLIGTYLAWIGSACIFIAFNTEILKSKK